MISSKSAFSFGLGLTGIALIASRCGASDPVSFIFPENKALDLQPSSTGGFSDVSAFDTHPTFSVPPAYNVYYYKVEQTGYYNETVSPNYYDDAGCSVPSDSSWPSNGCVCFEPDYLQTSFYEMSKEAQDVPTNAFGYRTAFNTSVTGGVTVAGWFKASDTSGAPIYASDSHPGTQYNHILTRGEKSSWAAGYNFGMGKWNGFRFEVILGGGGRITAQCPNQWYPGINVWHYVVATYDAEQGRIAMYVDNVLQGENFVNTTWPDWTREQRDIKWGTNEAQVGKTRIGNGYDASDKQFFGCTGGLTLYGGAVQTVPLVEPAPIAIAPLVPGTTVQAQTFPEDCTAVTSCADFQKLLEESAADGSTAKICASDTPIDCRATKQNAAKIVLNADTLGGTGKVTKAKCISNDLTVSRCVVDMSPNYNNDDPSGAYYGKALAYLGILMKDASSLYLEGFEFDGVQGNSNINYVQDGSNFVCRGCVFRNIVAGDTARGAVARDVVRSRPCGPTASLGNIVFDQCMFEGNVGELIYAQDSVLTVTNSIFQNNIQGGSRKGGFITYTGEAVNSFDHTLTNNTFINNDATSSNNIWLNRGIPAVCKENAPAGWENRDDCQSLLTKYTGNCQYENKDNFSCSNGLSINWPMSQCVAFDTCAETSRSLNDIYPVIDSPDVSTYTIPKQVGWSKTCAPSPTPSTAPSTSVHPSAAPSSTPSTSVYPSIAPSQTPSIAPSMHPSLASSTTPSTAPSMHPSVALSTPPSERPSVAPSVKETEPAPLEAPTSPTQETPETQVSTCNIEVEVHIVDQTRTQCPNGKVSCKIVLSNENMHLYSELVADLHVKVVDAPADYSPADTAQLFNNAGAGFSIASGSVATACITHSQASGINLAVACGEFNGEEVCSSEEIVSSASGSTRIKFMTLTLSSSSSSKSKSRAAKTKRAKGTGGFHLRRLLHEDETADSMLSVVYPQSFTWESSGEDYYPMILSPDADTWTVDACVYVPVGHVLEAVLDGNSEPLPLDGECTHVVVPGEDIVLLFKTVGGTSSGGGRLRKRALNIFDQYIHGHLSVGDVTLFQNTPETIDFDTIPLEANP